MSLASTVQRITTSRPVEVYQYYGSMNGSLLASGIAYNVVFSIFPLLVIAFTALAAFLGGRPDLQQELVTNINEAVGQKLVGMTAADGALVSISSLVRTNVVSVTGVIGVLALLWTGLGLVAAMRQGMQAVLGLSAKGNFLAVKLLDLVSLIAFGIGVVVLLGASVGATSATDAVLDLIGRSGPAASVLLQVVGQAVAVVFLFLLMLYMLRVLAQNPVPVKTLIGAALFGTAGIAVLRLVTGLIVGSAARNPLLASAAVVVAILLVANLLSQIVLIAAAWAADSAVRAGVAPQQTLASVLQFRAVAARQRATAAESAADKVEEVAAHQGVPFGVRDETRLALSLRAEAEAAHEVAVRATEQRMREG